MDKRFDRRKFLKPSGMSLGVGALISVAPAMAGAGPAATVRGWLRSQNGEEVTPFNLVQLSDAQVRFQGPQSQGHESIRTKSTINGLDAQPF
jgi:hypothetical protein